MITGEESSDTFSKENAPKVTEQDLCVDLLLQTSIIAWSELQRFFAAGTVLLLSNSQDLVDVATKIVEDDMEFVSKLHGAGDLKAVPDELAQTFVENDAEVWCVVVRPFVLIQQITD